MGAAKDRSGGSRPWRVANPDLARAMQELRRSSAASRHVPRALKGTRAQRERDAIRDQDRDAR